MSQPDNSGQRYDVHLSGNIAKKLRNIQRRASREGRGKAVLSAIREIVRRLQENPLEFGELLYRLPALRMMVHHGAISPLFVDLAISEDRPLVIIKGIELLS